jgi:hypothetical protein
VRYIKLCDSDNHLDAMRGIGLALAVGFLLWTVTIATLTGATKFARTDSEVASYSGSSVCSDIDDDNPTSDCNLSDPV